MIKQVYQCDFCQTVYDRKPSINVCGNCGHEICPECHCDIYKCVECGGFFCYDCMEREDICKLCFNEGESD